MNRTTVQSLAVFLVVLLAHPVHAQVRIERGRNGPNGTLTILGEQTQIGVSARDLNASEAERLKVDGGVYIETVFPDSPAAKAGLKAADVITEFDGERVRSLQHFTRLVRESAPDRSLHLKYQRDGRSSDVSVTPTSGTVKSLHIPSLPDLNLRTWGALPNTWVPPLGGLPPGTWAPPLGGAGGFGNRRGAQLGVTVQDLTPELAAYFGASDGVLVSSVMADSSAFRAGIKVGDVIMSSNGRPVFEASDLTRDVNALSGGGELTLVIVRDKKEMTIKVTIDATIRGFGTAGTSDFQRLRVSRASSRQA